MAVKKEVKIGAIVLGGIIVLYFGINFLKGVDFFSSEKRVYAIYDRVEGLAPSNIIQVNGLKAGFVRDIKLLPDHSGRIIVTMLIKNEMKIPRNSVAQIISTDLLGTKGIKLLFGNSTEDLQNGDTLQSDIQKSLSEEVSAQVAPIKMKAENLLSSLDSVTTILRDVFNEQTKQNLKSSFASISTSLQSIENITNSVDTMMRKESGKIKSIIGNIEFITSNLRDNSQHISNAIENIANISDTLRKANLTATLENTKKTLEMTTQIFDKVNKGKGSLGMLVNDDSLYLNLNATAHSLDALLKDLKANPRRYVHFSLVGGGGKSK
jgi:phospholipid/cholesterol/gamma-HCH transport system substrate-binding protein